MTETTLESEHNRSTIVRRPLLEMMTHARNRYRRMPLVVRRNVDFALGTGIYKRPMRRRGALFIHVPKAAGTAVSQALFGLSAVGHYTAEEARDYDPKLFARLFSFAFVRDPIDRAFSAYNFLRTSGTAEVPVAFPTRYAHISEQSFDEFVEWLTSIDVDKSNPVLHRQSKYVCDEKGEILVRYVGRFEFIEQNFLVICQQLQIDALLEHRNASAPRATRTLDAATERRIREIYDADFANFDYS